MKDAINGTGLERRPDRQGRQAGSQSETKFAGFDDNCEVKGRAIKEIRALNGGIFAKDCSKVV